MILWSARAALGQVGQAEMTGEVRDPTGAVVPGARVEAREARTNQLYQTKTGASGVYRLPAVKPGVYTLAVEAAGFKRSVLEGVRISTGERARLDVELTLGSLAESTTATARAPLLNTESSSLGQVIASTDVVDLPLNGRSFIQLVGLAPGVALPPGSVFPRINGGRPRVNEYLFDGISVIQPEPGTVPFFPIIDAIQEFKVKTNSPPAEFGRFNGGVINLTMRSGTNQIAGTVFGFLRNEALNARNPFAPRTETNPGKPRFRRNQVGFVLGGPLNKDRTFFFVDYQATRQSVGVVRISTVPTSLQRQGIFTEPIGGRVPAIYDPATTQTGPGGTFTRSRFPGNQIPETRFDPVASLLLERYPLPNQPGTANNYRRLGDEAQAQDQFDFRIDHRLSSRDQLMGRLSVSRDTTDPVTPLPEGSGLISSGAIGLTRTGAQSLALSHVRTLGDFTLNQLRFGYTRRTVGRTGVRLDGPASVALRLLGIPANAAFEDALPSFVVDGFQQLGSPLNTDSNSRTDVTQLVDTFSLQRERHLFKFGLDFRWERLDIVQPPSPTGSFRFTTQGTDLPGTTGTGVSLASFLLGQVQTFSIDLQQTTLRPRAHVQEYFVQDDFRVSRRLSLNLGLRYTLNFPSTESEDQAAVFNLETQELEYLGRAGFSRSARQLHGLNFGPRVGGSYQLNDRTVVRMGYAVVWIEQAGITTPFTTPQFPFLQTVGQRSLDDVNPAFRLAQGPSVEPLPLTPDAGIGQGVFSADRDLGSGYIQQWNLAVQREISPRLAFEIAYAGSKGTHIGVPDTNLNQLTVEQLQLGNALLQRVPNPFFGEISTFSSLGGSTITRAQLLKPYPRFTNVSLYRNNVGNTSYHALQLKLEKRFSQGLSALVSYTRSRLIDDASSVFDASILAGPVANFPVADSYNRQRERDHSNGDMPHVFSAGFTWALPFGPGRLAPGGFLGALVCGWQLAGVITYQSGLPLSVTQATNFNSFAGFGTQRPNLVGDPELPASERGAARWFNTAAFEIAPQFTIGTSSRNPVRGPDYRNLALVLSRREALAAGASLEFRLEVFNLTNTPHWGAPNVVLGTPGFGSITSALDPRVIQLGVKLSF